MLTLLRRPLREADATRTFYVLTAVTAFCFALCFTLGLVFQFRVIGLDPFQMVLVGTVLELTCFVFEVPTGIVADLYSRRVSVIIGFFLIGCGFAFEGVVATFAAAVVGNVLWGIGIIPEHHFEPTPRGERESFAHLRAQFASGLTFARSRRVVRAFLLVSLLVGLASEVFDRLWRVRILDDFMMPTLFGGDEAVAFTVFALIGTSISLLASLAGSRWLPKRVVDEHPGLPVVFAALVQVAAVVGVAVFGNLWLALVAVWVRGACTAFSTPIEAARINRNLERSSRATVLSMNSQANAIGQVVGGPPLGALATRTSIPIALLVAAAVQLPSVIAFWRVRRIGADAGQRG